ncbi:hypothetical protein [Planotetraspora sp. GP83]|uniref:hypothetical protein n=1 Tax=Planotetraspora sp. GP83 TaxID=3156264 RepID=UPI003511BB31
MTASLKPDPPRDEYWNHNVRYHRVVLDAVPYGCDTALDVGCGDGLLRLLPGAHVRRLLLLRYSIVWHKPPE